MVTTKLNLSMTEPQVRQIYAKQGDTGRVLDITLDQTPEDGTLRILRPDGTEVTSEAVTGGSSESGETVTFESMTEADVTELTAGIEPVQDLNGYDAPWVGGAGKNLFNSAGLNRYSQNGITVTQPSDGTLVFNGTATATAFFAMTNTGYASNSYVISLNNTSVSNGFHVSVANSGGTGFLDAPANAVNKFATFTNEPSTIYLYVASGTTLSNFVVKPQLELGSTAPTSWQPYSNICPITGHDEVTVTRTGKNLIDTSTVTVSGITFTQDNEGRLSASPNNSDPRPWTYANSQYKVTLPKGSYTLVVEVVTATSSTYGALRAYNSDGTQLIIIDPFRTVGIKTASLTLTEETSIGVIAKQYDTVYRLMIVASGESTFYEPYQSNTYTTSLGQTVYGGTLDLVSGVLTVTHRFITIDENTSIGKESASWNPNNNVFYHGLGNGANKGKWGSTAVTPNIVSNYCSAVSYSTIQNTSESYKVAFTAGGQYIDWSAPLTNVADMKTFLASNPLEFCYELATPLTYQLTAQQIKTLVGTNNVWASSGDIVNITFTYGGLLSELPSEATEIVGKCYCDVEQNGVSSMPFTLNVKKNERES